MNRRTRLVAVLANGMFLSMTLMAVMMPQAAATPGRNSPATAEDCGNGPFEGIFNFGDTYVGTGPPVEEDFYKCNVWQGQIFQIALWASPDVIVSVHRSVNGSLEEITRGYASEPVNVQGLGTLALADLTVLVYRTELLYIKISPPTGANPSSTFTYNLYFRAFNATVLGNGDSVSPTPGDDSINGWSYPYLWPFRWTNDWYLINATNSPTGNNVNYRLTLTQDCSTAMYDMYLYRYLDYNSERLDLVNHSVAMQRRVSRTALTTAPDVLDFAPSLYDGYYLLRVHAAENGSFALGSTDRFTYQVAVTTVGGYAKDGNDRLGDGPLVSISQTVGGSLNGRDDSSDFVRLQLYSGDDVGLSLQLSRANSEIVSWGLRFRVIVFSPNGTIAADAQNWGVAGNNLYFNPYVTIPSFIATEDGVYNVGLFTADGAINAWDALQATGGVGANWAGWSLTVSLPNRPPFLNVSNPPPEGIVFNEDGQFQFSMARTFIDPEGKIGYPIYGPVLTSSNLTATIGSGIVTVHAAPDWFGSDYLTVTVKDDAPSNTQTVRVNVTVLPVNDEPRTYPGASNYSVIILPEDGSATVPMRSIFYDVDDTELVFTSGGITSQDVAVVINNVSQVATITPNLNWNGEFDVTWTATDPGGLLHDFNSHVVVTPVNDPPRETDTRLPRIVIDEGQDFFINLTSHFYDFDQGDTLRYYGSVDPSVAEYIRVNNTNLDPRDPNMRIYVLDQYRSNYFTNGPVPIKFWVLDSSDNVDGTTGIPVVVEKSTFLEIVNVNDPPIVDEIQPDPDEVAITDYTEGDTITFAVTRVVDPDNTFYPDTDTQWFYKWYVNGAEIVGQTTQTFVFRTVLDATQAGQWAAGHYVVSVQVFDAAGAQAQLEPEWEFTVAQKNRAPNVQLLQPTQVTFQEGEPIRFQALVSDDDPEDSPTVQWKYVDPNTGQEVVASDQEQFTRMLDPGTYTVTVVVTDGNATVTQDVQLTVTAHKLNTPGFEGVFAAVSLGAVALAAAGSRRRRGR